MRILILLTIAALAGAGAVLVWQARTSTPRVLNAQPISGDPHMAIATFAAGCFWGVQATFDSVPGVTKTTVGYTGGHTRSPTYEDVCSHTTGHAEAVRVEFDPTRVTYEALLGVFWGSHDPTTLNRQGPDVGDQYRSAVFYHTPEQRDAAVKVREELDKSGKFGRPIVTEITPAGEFYVAEDYHQEYLAKRGLASCHVTP
jgi:peptide-methionine (S)-S-oxide reductase